VAGAHQAVPLQLGVGSTDRVDVDAELGREGAYRWEPLSGSELAVGDQKRDAGADLRRDSQVRARVDREA